MTAKKTAYDDDSDVQRRDFFGQLLRELARPAFEFKRGLQEGKPSDVPETWLRPPSVSDETRFLNRCDRSGECVVACPANAIFAREDDGTPYIDPQKQPCVVCSDLACMAACPSGALSHREFHELGMGVAEVAHGVCVRSSGEECKLCVEACPLHERGETVLDVTLDGRIHVYVDACVGCGVCERQCPTDPPAIWVNPTRLRAVGE